MPGGLFTNWQARENSPRILALHADNKELRILLEQRNANPPRLTIAQLDGSRTDQLMKRNSQLSKFITHLATLCHYTEHDDITMHMQSMSLDWIFTYLQRHYRRQTKGANFIKIVENSLKKEHRTRNSTNNTELRSQTTYARPGT